MENIERRPLRAPGSLALRRPKEERYAQQRSLGCGQREAARKAGLDDYTGIFAKYERKLRVQNRIAFLRAQDLTPEYHHAKRRLIEQRLEQAAFGNMFEWVKIQDGKPVIDWETLAQHELGVTISELRLHPETGKVTYIGRDNALGALSQLREMRGYKATDHLRVSVALETMSDEDLLRIATQQLPALPAPDSEPMAGVDNGEDPESDDPAL